MRAGNIFVFIFCYPSARSLKPKAKKLPFFLPFILSMLCFFVAFSVPMGYLHFMNSSELKQIRLEFGLTQLDFARCLKTPFGTYVKWEHGDRRVPGVVEVALRAVRSEIEKEKKEGEK